MGKTVTRRHVTAEARGLLRVGVCGICGGLNGNGAVFLSQYFIFALSVPFHNAPHASPSTGVLISPYPDLLPDIFCLMVIIFRLRLVLFYIYIVLIFLQLW